MVDNFSVKNEAGLWIILTPQSGYLTTLANRKKPKPVHMRKTDSLKRNPWNALKAFRAVLLMAVLLTAASASFAQVNYTRSTFTGTYVPITSGGGASTAGATGDGVLTTGLPIGFNFDYNGTVYTTFGVSTDGYLSFTATSNSLTNTNLYSTTAPNAVIAPWWDDLNTNAVGTNPAGSILYQTTGTTGNQVLTVQWIVSSYWSATNGQPAC